MQTLLRSCTAGQLLVIAIITGFLSPATGNDLKDLSTRLAGDPIPACATWSITRPPCRR